MQQVAFCLSFFSPPCILHIFSIVAVYVLFGWLPARLPIPIFFSRLFFRAAPHSPSVFLPPPALAFYDLDKRLSHPGPHCLCSFEFYPFILVLMLLSQFFFFHTFFPIRPAASCPSNTPSALRTSTPPCVRTWLVCCFALSASNNERHNVLFFLKLGLPVIRSSASERA